MSLSEKLIRKSSLIFLFFLALGVLASSFYIVNNSREIESRRHEQFLAESEKKFELLKEKLSRKKLVLTGIQHFFAASESVSEDEFNTFARPLLADYSLKSICWSSSKGSIRYAVNTSATTKRFCQDFRYSELNRVIEGGTKHHVLLSNFVKSRGGQKGYASLVFEIGSLLPQEVSLALSDSLLVSDKLRNRLSDYSLGKQGAQPAKDLGESSDTRYFQAGEFGEYQFIYLTRKKADGLVSDSNAWFVAILILAVFIFIGLYFRVFANKSQEVEEQVKEKTKQLKESNLKRIEEARKQAELKKQINQIQKMEAVGQLTGGIAHDFNNKLAIIQANLEILNLPDQKQDVYRKCSQAIQNSVNQAAKLTSQLLAYGSKQAIQTKNTDLNGLIKNSIRLLERVMSPNINIKLDLSEDQAAIVKVDASQIDQVIMNLMLNARDAIGKGGGDIIVSTQREQVTKEDIIGNPRLDLEAGSYVRLSIKDTGDGILEEDHAKVFEPFFTTKDIGKGTGLGLSVVYGIVSQHNAKITLKSEPGLGTEFSIFFSLVNEGHIETETVEVSGSVLESKTVLYVEDEEELRDLVTQALEGHDLRVIPCEDGEAAWEVFNKRGSEIDIIVSDVMMPKMTGGELLKKVRDHGSTIPFVFTSGYSKEEISKDGNLPENTRFIFKPFSFQGLLNEVSEILEESGSKQKAL